MQTPCHSVVASLRHGGRSLCSLPSGGCPPVPWQHNWVPTFSDTPLCVSPTSLSLHLLVPLSGMPSALLPSSPSTIPQTIGSANYLHCSKPNLWVPSPRESFLSFSFFWLHHKACRILIPWPGIEPLLLAEEVWSLNHWTTREPWRSVFLPMSYLELIATLVLSLNSLLSHIVINGFRGRGEGGFLLWY